jgi:alanine-glyoxylate transaminase/serine-glyoxylate transaminase/serine-pyruvate transaminase
MLGRMTDFRPLQPSERVLMGPGPSDVPPSVRGALAAPTLGHLDPEFLEIMDEVRSMLRSVFGTKHELTMPMSGTGSSGMETCLVNLLEPGDRALVCVNGVFGTRMADLARRLGAEVVTVEAPWGRAMDPEDIRRAAKDGGFRVLCVVHAETSTGALTSLEGLRSIADEAGAFLLADTVTSLGGMPVELDRHGVDAAYSGTQKCLSCPPGLAPVSLSDRAWEHVKGRTHPVSSWYLDLALIARYWGGERAYHHTAPIHMMYALHESLRLVLEEGPKRRFERHRQNARALRAGLEAMGLELPVPNGERLDPLTLVRIPDGVDDAQVRGSLRERHGIEIGGGLGDFKGKAWRIGLMGASCTPRHVTLCLGALQQTLRAQGYRPAGDALEAAQAVWDG